MNLYQRLLGRAHREGARPRRGQARLELFSLLAILMVGVLAIGATSAGAEEDEAPDAQTTLAVIATSGGAGELLNGAEQGVVIQAAEAGPGDAEFEACMRELGVELPGPSFHESTEDGDDAGPSVESAPLDEAFIEAAEQCGHTIEGFTHELGAEAPAVLADEVAAFHECLSAANVDLPQAEMTPPSGEPAAGSVAMHLSVGSNDPDLQAAFEQCAALLPEGVVTVGAAESD